ncbi:MAG: hypothetical protein A3G93_00775 [Nitrospinae bacterium RIFCSPLOWO2_12_FULL_45_22]|nr:MAG: hypothetical protein A3G93_00775 [Nitrospinae bacterium RIFCSPLOWO2_12_FULL_45_22]
MINSQKGLDSLIRLVSNVTDAFTAALFLPNEAGTVLKLTSFHSLSHHIQKGATIQIGHGLIGWVAQTRQNLNVSEFQRDTKTLQLYSHDEEIKSFLAVPVELNELTGVLCIDSKRHYVFTSKVEKILTGFAQEFARLLTGHQSENKDNDKDIITLDIITLLEMSQGLCSHPERPWVLDFLGSLSNKIIPYEGLLVVLLDKINGSYSIVKTAGEGLHKLKGITVSLSQSLVGWVIKNASPLKLVELKGYPGKTYILCPNEPQMKVNSFLGIPLTADRKVLGGWGFLSNKSACFNDQHLQVGSLIATQAAMALAYATMKEERQTLGSLDPSTGIYNFRQFVKTISDKLAQGIDYQLLIIEPDNLEQLGNRYSHTICEEATKQIAQILLMTAKDEDLVSRSVSDGFLLALAQTDSEAAYKHAEYIRKVVEETILLVCNKEIHLTVTIGITPLLPSRNKHDIQAHLFRSITSFNSNNLDKFKGKNRVLADSFISTLSA